MNMNKMNYMKKHVSILLMLFVLLIPVTSKAQIYIMDEDEEINSLRTSTTDVWFNGGVPTQGGDDDQFAPLAEGLVLLMGLGGAYLLKKRKKED